MMQITVFGASGKVGRLVVKEALARGYIVVAVVHKHNPLGEHDGLKLVKGDIRDPAIVTAALGGSQAVISCLGSWGTKSRDIVTTATREIVPAMQALGIKRIITLTGSGALAPGAKDGIGHKLMMALSRPFPAGKVFADGEEHMKLLVASNLDWTTIRSPVMNSRAGGDYQLSLKLGNLFETIDRQTVARAMIDQLEAPNFIRQAPIIHSVGSEAV